MCKSVRPIAWVLSSEVVVTAVITAVASFSDSIDTASILTGCLIFLIPNTYFTLYAFRYTGAQWIPSTVQLFYRGQMGKLLLAAVGFALAFRFYAGLNAPQVFAAYGIMIGFNVLVAGFVCNRFDLNQRLNQTHQNK